MHIPLLSSFNRLTEFPTTEAGKDWYIFYFNGANKLISISILEKFFKVRKIDCRIWIPCKKILVYRHNNLILMNEPIYFDYVFVNFNFSWDTFLYIKEEIKYVKVLGDGDEPYRLTEEELNNIKAAHMALNTSVNEASVKNFKYSPGEIVRIAYGPFSGMTGKIQEITSTQVILAVSCFGKETRFFVPTDKSFYMIQSI